MTLGSRFRTASILGILAALATTASAGAVTVTEFQIEPGSAPGSHLPRYIQVGPDQNIWYADGGTSPGIGRISTSGVRLPQIADPAKPVDLVAAPDGTVYWTTDSGLGRRLPNGQVGSYAGRPSYSIALTVDGELRWGGKSTKSEYSAVCRFDPGTWGSESSGLSCVGITGNTPGRVTGLTRAGDGRLWGAWYEANTIGALDANADAVDLTIALPSGSGPARIALGADGNLWATMFDASAVDRITPAGVRTRFLLPAGAKPNDIASGPDGALWITEYGANKIARMTTAGSLTNEFEIPTPDSLPTGIVAGPDGAIWFTETAGERIGRISLDAVGGVSDDLAPRFLKGPVFDPKRFRVAAKNTRKFARPGKRVRKGSSLRFTLSEAATTTIVIARAAPGRKVGRRCKRPTPANKRRSRCKRYRTVATLRRNSFQGANSVAFSGRIAGKKLAVGSYRATVTATDTAGNASKAAMASFKVVP